MFWVPVAAEPVSAVVFLPDHDRRRQAAPLRDTTPESAPSSVAAEPVSAGGSCSSLRRSLSPTLLFKIDVARGDPL